MRRTRVRPILSVGFLLITMGILTMSGVLISTPVYASAAKCCDAGGDPGCLDGGSACRAEGYCAFDNGYAQHCVRSGMLWWATCAWQGGC
jgi:hypothetical protein